MSLPLFPSPFRHNRGTVHSQLRPYPGKSLPYRPSLAPPPPPTFVGTPSFPYLRPVPDMPVDSPTSPQIPATVKRGEKAEKKFNCSVDGLRARQRVAAMHEDCVPKCPSSMLRPSRTPVSRPQVHGCRTHEYILDLVGPSASVSRTAASTPPAPKADLELQDLQPSMELRSHSSPTSLHGQRQVYQRWGRSSSWLHMWKR
ncbi:uncharacterized protein LOC123408877 isoform X2 [Hordeum vulgare subsp. vulgare]|uniref:uncharacterized protein LOC123408877 isoform X2 n=1 Tax=Hordeum vulgare subsp. vulgare TaxID=112509 RepID=UPI001D1A3552|nr:uncharacterized protein LOC123408877 isoform X2 [Hordeum vulgare subsp. vulgare]